MRVLDENEIKSVTGGVTAGDLLGSAGNAVASTTITRNVTRVVKSSVGNYAVVTTTISVGDTSTSSQTVVSTD